tara:strand:- start:657 stop:1562 length:906 start_codon:yes stop_codon:yes gene_type:complete
MARTTRPTTEDYNFDVKMQELYTQDQKPTGFWGTRRTDTGQVLGVTSDKYGLLLNSDLIDSVEGTFSDKKMDFTRKVFVARDGASMYARYDFPNEQAKVGGISSMNVGDVMGMRITARNSYDRSCTGDLELGILRVLCKNGMKSVKRAFGFKQKHSRKLNLDGVSDAVDRAVEAFSTVGEDFGLLADRPVDDTIGDYILKNLESDKVLSSKLRQEITKLWLTPDLMINYGAGEKAKRNLFTLYNCSTQHLTHRVESERFEYADKVNQNVLTKFVKACKEKKTWDKLVRIPTIKSGDVLVTS